MKPSRVCLSLLALLSSSNAWVLNCPPLSGGRESFVSALRSSTSETATPSGSKYTLDGEEIRAPLTPLGNLVLVKVKDTLTATLGGILLPDESKERPTEGLVIRAGPGKIHPFTAVRIHNPIKEGMSVLYGKYDGKAITYNEDSCQMIRDDDCMLYYDGVTMNLNNVMPVRDYVLVALDIQESLATKSGVVIAQQVVKGNAPCTGTVTKVGEGRMASNGELTTSPVQVGDKVKFKDYAGNDVTIEGKKYSLVKMVDMLSSLGPDALAALEKGEEVASP